MPVSHEGNAQIAFRIARDLDQLRQEAVATAEGLAGLWIDKVENRTSSTGAAQTCLPADLVAIITAESRPPVPFIADDIMETFDDARAAQAFAPLGDMSRSG